MSGAGDRPSEAAPGPQTAASPAPGADGHLGHLGHRSPATAAGAESEINALIETLHDTGERIETLTAGQVDAVLSHDGRTFLLRRAQDQLRFDDAARQAAIIDALPAHIALLDASGRIVSVNAAWRRFASANLLQAPAQRLGSNYLGVCDAAQGEGAPLAALAAAGIRSVMDGSQPNYTLEYACHSPSAQRWFLLTASSLVAGGPGGAVLMHLDVTERKRDQDALRELNADLERRVRERTAELSLARDEALQANRAKSSFLATMSHEIRTPMNGVIGMIDVLQQTGLKDDQLEMVDLVRDSAFSLLKIIEDILDFSKIEAGRMNIEQAPLRLSDVVERGCEMLDHLAADRDVRLAVFVDPALRQSVAGDATRLRQVLINLTANAIKFSSGRATVPVEVSVRALLVRREAQAFWVDLVVADNGIGMDEATQAWLFTPFSQADASTTRRFGGTGLGLAISAMLVRLMGGEISVRSAPGQGSTFTVRLRLTLAEAAVGAATALADDPLDDAPARSEAAGLHCRIVGGTAALADDIAAYLGHAGAQVTRSADLAAAAAAERPPGLALWLLLPGTAVPALAALRALSPAGRLVQTGFVVIGRGARRRPRVEAPDLVLLDADSLCRRRLFKTLALASGRWGTGAGKDDRDVGARLDATSQRREARMQGRLILVAEDNQTNRAVIWRQLALIGFAAEVVVDGREALARWRTGHYALLLTDLHMPQMDGYALAAAIRAEEPAGQRMPIMALTANAQRDEELHCRAAGMDAYLTKPIQLGELAAAIEAWLGPQPGKAANLPEAPARAASPPPSSWPGDVADTDAAPADLRVLFALVGNDPEVIADVLQAFRESAATSASQLQHAIAQASAAELSQAIHALKPGARSVGAFGLSRLCAEVEAAMAAARPPLPAALVSSLLNELDSVLRYLENQAPEAGT